MIHVVGEGEPLRQGINLYPLRDLHSVGFRLRIGRWMVLWVRYRKRFNDILINGRPFREFYEL